MRPDGSAGLMRDDPDGAQLIRSRRFGGAGCDALQHRSAERAKGRSRLRASLQHELAEQSAMRGAAARAEGAAVEVQHRGGGTAWGGRKFVGGGAGVAHTLLGDEPAAPHSTREDAVGQPKCEPNAPSVNSLGSAVAAENLSAETAMRFPCD
jgi:hypothetical protein